MSEESSSKKEEEIFGIPMSKAGILLGGAGLLAAIIMPFVKPQIEQMQNDMRNRQAYAQQQQILAAQAQQQQLQAQQQHLQNQAIQEQQEMTIQSEPQQPQGADPSVAIEQDPFQRTRRVRIPEVESDSSGTGRFNNISI